MTTIRYPFGPRPRPVAGLSRRALLASAAALPVLAAFPFTAAAAPTARVRPGSPGWPSEADWAALSKDVGGRLQPVARPVFDAGTATLHANPFWLRDQAGLTQSSGWIDAWTSSPSAYVVRAASAADVAAAVTFAARHNLRLVVKGAGHSYVGGSNAPDSLLVWTRDLDTITLHDDFVAETSTEAPVPAVTVGAGCIWLDVYSAVTMAGGRYVQGGGCTTVGVAGLVQGGGFGSFSKTFGIAAASLLEAEIVTADGEIKVVNAEIEPDLFWALKGGGGGTFGVVTRLTLKTHDLPATFGIVLWTVAATSDDALHRLMARFVDLYADRLMNPHWGEQAGANPHNRFSVTMLFQGLDEAAAREAWRPFTDFVAAHPDDYKEEAPMLVATQPATSFWDSDFLNKHAPGVITMDNRPDAKPGHFWWASNTDEAGTFWHGYQSIWLPAALLSADRRAALVDAWFQATRQWSVTFHFNKGLAGAPAEAIAASRDTAMNPEVLDAFALAIIAYDGPSIYSGLSDSDRAAARADSQRIAAAMNALRTVAPTAGCYMSESDYGLEDWQHGFWGQNWRRLSQAKQHYDPDGLFIIHHGVGSEGWSPDGFTRI